MFKQKKVAIMGTGNIAKIMAKTIKKMKGVKCYCVASRDLTRAQMFAKEFGIAKAYGSYEEMMQDKKIDLVYIATPHSEHYQNMKLCIENGKAVLCEKAFTVNAKQAEEIFALAKEKNVFVAEAIWTRYMPMLQTIREIINSEIVGQPVMLTANLGYPINHIERMVNPNLAGGALLDLGVYTLNFASMIFDEEIDNMESLCTKVVSGVDASNGIVISYKSGKMAVLNSSMMGVFDRRGMIYCTKGYIEIENINNFESIAIYGEDRALKRKIKAPKQITGYEYEVEASLEAISNGEIECWQMPHAQSIYMMKLMDQIRRKWGLKYPFELQGEELLSDHSAIIETASNDVKHFYM